MHEKPADIDPAQVPNQDIQVTESFLRDNEPLLVFLAQTIMQASLEVPGIIDSDIREALEALIRTYRTLESGVYYETRPANPLANHICSAVQGAADQFRQREREQGGVTRTRDADIFGVLAFLQRIEFDRNNGRRRGRAFLDFLRVQFGAGAGAPAPAEPPSPLIIP
jgi:hypothetical protein